MSDVTSAVAAARAAAATWNQQPLDVRLQPLVRLRQLIVDQQDDIAAEISSATGKPPAEATINELIPTLELLRFHEKHAARILARECRPTPLIFPRARSYVTWHPRGVVAVIGPSNFPFQLTLAPMVTALAAGNTVVAKVSEHTSSVGTLLERLIRQAGFPADVVRVVSGGAEVGEELARSAPDLLFLTGGVETGRRVMALTAQSLTPVILELGGKDPMIVFSDAPFERAVQGAVYGAFANAGQVCVSVDKILVERPLLERFAAAVAAEALKVKVAGAAAGTRAGESFGDVGALISETQVQRFRDLVADALEKGATPLIPVSFEGRHARPLVLTNVGSSMRIMREEVFGPLVSVVPFDGEDDAVRQANASVFGLNASVWTRDLARGERVARRLVVGNCAVNDVIKNIGNPHLPFGGVKHSGIGVYHGPEGLRAFSRPMSVMVNRGVWKRELNWFPYSAERFRQVRMMIRARYGAGSWFTRLRQLISAGRAQSPR